MQTRRWLCLSPKNVSCFGNQLLSKLRPQPRDPFRARLRHPAKAGAEEGVFLFAFQREAASFGVELAEFFGELHPIGVAFGEGGALAFGDSDFVERGDGAPAWQL